MTPAAFRAVPTDPVLAEGVERFSLPMIPEGPKQRRVIAMDYNLFVRHSDGDRAH